MHKNQLLNNKKNSLIDQFLTPEKIVKANKDILPKYDKLINALKQEKIVRPSDVKQSTDNVIVMKNIPYKSIIKNDDYKKNIISAEDMLVHKVTIKDREGVSDALQLLRKSMDEINVQNKLKYAPEKYNKHKDDFEYKHTYISRVKYDAPTSLDVKNDTVAHYKIIQEKEEKGKQQRDDIIRSMKELYLSKDELI